MVVGFRRLLPKPVQVGAMQGSNPQGPVGYQALTDAAPQLAPQNIYWPREVEEIALAWGGLPEPLKAAEAAKSFDVRA